MSSKSDFIQALQKEKTTLSAFEISQKLRLQCGCLSICQSDDKLEVSHTRAYMVKYSDKPFRSPENPELYACIISTKQSMAWFQLVWIKEIIQILDRTSHRTDTSEKLGSMLDNRMATSPNGNGTPSHIIADKTGFTLALGSAIPLTYREILREQGYLEKYSLSQLEEMLVIPKEFVRFVLESSFEKTFDEALQHCD